MEFLTVVALLCIFVIYLGIRTESAEGSSESASRGKNDGKKLWGILSDSAASIFTSRFLIAFAVCFAISTVMMAYAGYWHTLQMGAIITALQVGIYFPSYAYIGILQVSLLGGLMFARHMEKSVFYKRVVWWLFPAGVVCFFLGHLGLMIREPGDSGMGDMIPVFGAMPLFGEAFLVVYMVTEISFRFFASPKKKYVIPGK